MLGWEDAFIEADLDLAKENLAMRRWEVLTHAREIQMIAETDGPTPEMAAAHLPDVSYDFYQWCARFFSNVLYGNSLSDPNDVDAIKSIFKTVICSDALKESPYPFLYGGSEDKAQMFGIDSTVEINTPRGKKERKRRKKKMKIN